MIDRANQLSECVAPKAWRLRAGSLLFIALFSLNGCRSNQPNAFGNEKEVTGAILAEDWAKVADLTRSVTFETPSVELRFIKGQALLALDKNNESSCLFLSVLTGDSSSVAESLKRWENWTQKLADKNPNNAASHYLKGDALSRLERWDDAIMAFNKALELNPDHALSLNARGLVYGVREQWDPALVDLTKAISLHQGRAGSYASLGAFWMMKQVGTKGAESAFNKALEISPDFVFALYGRGCMKSVLGKRSEAQRDLEEAGTKAGCLSGFLSDNIAVTLTRIQNEDEAILAQVKSENPSAEVHRRVEAMKKNGNTGFMSVDLRVVAAFHNKYPELRPMIEKEISKATQGDSNLARSVQRSANSLERGHILIQGLGNLIQGIKTEVVGRGSVAGIRPGGVGVGVGSVKVTQDYMAFGKGLSDHASRDIGSLHRIQLALPARNNPAGFKTDLEEAIWDEGKWPFEAMNGLFYKTQSVEISSKTEKGAGK